MIDGTVAYAITRNDEIKHIRLNEAVANACADIERIVYGYKNVEVVPVIISEVKGEVK